MKKLRCNNQSLLNLPAKPLLIVLSGPSGVGKDAILYRMKEADYPLKYIVTTTTRSQRAMEREDIDYQFLSEEVFQEMIGKKELLEWAKVYGNWYGVPKRPVEQALNEGLDVIIKVDIQGAASIKKRIPQAVLIFITPPSMKELAARINRRHTESPSDLSLRLETAKEEIKQVLLFDYVVISEHNRIDRAVSDIVAIITAEKCRVTPREIVFSD